MVEVVEKVLACIREHGLLRPGERVAAAVSGGPDSVALLRLLLELRRELGLVLAVAHFHHGIRGAEADADREFVVELARAHSLPLHTAAGDAPAHAAAHGLSLETAARELRYEWLRSLLRAGEATRVATGHTLDDQAETVVMRTLRGAGTRGLAGIFPLQRVGADTAIVRPLLRVRRREVEEYLRALGQPWREDQSNRDLRHLRNRVRHQLLPHLERDYNPSLARVLAESAEVARAEEEYWRGEAERLLPSVWREGVLDARALVRHPLALQRRLLRAAGESLGVSLHFEHVQGLLRLAAPAAGPAKSCELPGGWRATRVRGELRFQGETAVARPAAQDYEYRLPVPGQIRVAEIGSVIRVSLLSLSVATQAYNRAGLWDPRALAPELVIRNWRAGDRFWPAHSKSPKKVKTLLQERRVQPAERAGWPVAVSGDNIVWVRGFPPAQACRPDARAEQAVVIEEVAAEAGPGSKSS